ncbi:hypothetical protein HZA85_00840 [Candidatus Uhrbacteria bacterium]|nr:hypothetical protein [Candidatus Uhrbacteria bacterium]
MRLFLCGQDLSFFDVGLLDGQTFQTRRRFEVAPEAYLSTIDGFLKEVHILPQNLSGLVVVTGPGSFTAIRISLTIANTLHFVFDLPLFVMDNPDHLQPQELIATQKSLQPLDSAAFAEPQYGRPAQITTPRHGDKLLDS